VQIYKKTKDLNMSATKKQVHNGLKGFTLIELLVVIAIIVMLIGILVPGMQAFKRTADNLKQKSRFHAMEIGLELYLKDFREYPESKMIPETGGSNVVCGAHHLAEALFGRDSKGFDYKTDWYAPNGNKAIYSDEEMGSSEEEIKACDMRRKESYVDFKDVGVFNLGDGITVGEEWYPATGTLYAGTENFPSPVISDIFYKKTIRIENIETAQPQTFRVGTPVLYYKADTSKRMFRPTKDDPTTPVDDRADPSNWIYNYLDNAAMFTLPVHNKPDKIHVYAGLTGFDKFNEDITNQKVGQYAKPYNARSFLLISAGRDGIYGTNDDVTNF
jgi:prepilin-type N-terminal cleavage/methylation domain-containing protein